MRLQIQTIVSLPFSENTYVAWLPGHNDCVVIDPGTEPDAILAFLKEQGLTPAAILNTHGHSDHIAGNADLKQAYPDAPLAIGVGDAPMLTDANLNLSATYGFDLVSPPADQLLHEGDNVLFAGLTLDIREIPGHSPGHIVFIVRDAGLVFGGDVLFRGSIGRTDFPGGSFEMLAAGIRSKLYTLPDDTVIYPGHGPVTKVSHEKRTNPYVPAE
ncbi:MAG TPA: MBL fold metallo-hydrolase [Gemmataceae bacterium]|jgi:glyoxylase-like metal-dependent hydrolase (beta-lactamase superfamily II)|nr:MBL fold metallo-hydrolase [Gemmataceae bacterium]